MNNTKIYTGTVDVFDAQRGWGWIKYWDPSKGEERSVFVHQSQIEMDGFRTLIPGQKVDFYTGMNPKSKKYCAKEVKVVD